MLSDRPTLHDVAREAHVSHMTVSRVVRGEQSVSPTTRKRVQASIRRLGYHPDPTLSALAAYRTRAGGGQGSVIGFLFCDCDAYSHLVLEGGRAEAERLGYGIEPHQLSRSASSQSSLSRMLFHRGIRGLLFGPSQKPWKFTGWEWQHFAPVSLGAISHQPAMNNVTLDYFDGILKANSYLRELGARRVGMAVDPTLEGRTGHRWLGGYAAKHFSRPIPIYAGNLRDRKALLQWTRRNRLDGVLTIHKSVWEILSPTGMPVVFLNAFGCPVGVPHVAFETKKIGVEGVRLIHHQLLTRELGLPEEIKTLSLQGVLRPQSSDAAA